MAVDQIGGDHYGKVEGEQHWDRIYRLYGRGYFVGCATKYIERYHLKNGKEDLEKAISFIQKLIELEYPTPILHVQGQSPEAIEEYRPMLSNDDIKDFLKTDKQVFTQTIGLPK